MKIVEDEQNLYVVIIDMYRFDGSYLLAVPEVSINWSGIKMKIEGGI